MKRVKRYLPTIIAIGMIAAAMLAALAGYDWGP